MDEWRFPGWLMLARALARGLAWATDIVAIVVLCFVAQRWTATCGAVAPGIVGSVIALLIDSWQTVASAGQSFGFEPMKPHRTLVYDTFSFAVTLGGLVLMLVSNATAQQGDEQVDYFGQDAGSIHFRKSSMTSVAIRLLGVVIAWRIGFTMWACVDCYKNYQQAARRHERLTEVEEASSR